MFSINPDGALQASEIRNLAFGARLVILSACNSSTAEPWETGGNGGLAAAFSAAGADLILTSHWPVISTAAVEIVTNMMEADPQLVDLPSALRRATLKIISQGVERAHPRYWAPFSLTGAP